MKLKLLLISAFALILSGCVGPSDSTGWNSKQKQEFLQILQQDKYVSICEQKALYKKVVETRNSKLMTRLLYEYTKNLANGCIVNSSGFNEYKQEVKMDYIQKRLKANYTIEKILAPYVPQYRQFNALIAHYKSLKRSGKQSASLIKSIRLNIERVKLMKPGLGDTYALVNIPEFEIRIIEKDKTSLKMRIVIGTRKNQTPIFSEDLKYIIVNPTWNVPDSIARNEVIPGMLRDSNYLRNHRLVVRKDYNLKSPALKVSSLNAQNYVGGKGHVPFKFIEVPSNRNALGRVKFIFPNHHSVYMHDTPMKKLFKRKVRAYSHGCVRLGNPKYMMEFLVKNYTSTTYNNVIKKYNSKKTEYIKVTKRLPVHTAYFTAYVDDKGYLKTFGDIYSFDSIQQLNF